MDVPRLPSCAIMKEGKGGRELGAPLSIREYTIRVHSRDPFFLCSILRELERLRTALLLNSPLCKPKGK
jgi:hypothetical protein